MKSFNLEFKWDSLPRIIEFIEITLVGVVDIGANSYQQVNSRGESIDDTNVLSVCHYFQQISVVSDAARGFVANKSNGCSQQICWPMEYTTVYD